MLTAWCLICPSQSIVSAVERAVLPFNQSSQSKLNPISVTSAHHLIPALRCSFFGLQLTARPLTFSGRSISYLRIMFVRLLTASL